MEKERQLYLKWKNNKEYKSFDGAVITDCRAKETMVVTRYGGDFMLSFFDNETDLLKFVFVAQMKRNSIHMWNSVLKKFYEIKSKLIQR